MKIKGTKTKTPRVAAVRRKHAKFLVTPEEKAIIQGFAKLAELPFSAYVREIATTGHINHLPSVNAETMNLLREIHLEMRRARADRAHRDSNLNQAVWLVHIEKLDATILPILEDLQKSEERGVETDKALLELMTKVYEMLLGKASKKMLGGGK